MKPDVIEREIVNNSPLGDYSRGQDHHDLPDYSASMVMQDPEAPEPYDLENASSIAPSDIDVIYHYKGYRDQSRSGPIRLSSLAVGNNTNNKLQSTPLARLSPSSEMSHQTPRILTLQDISGKPTQSADDAALTPQRQLWQRPELFKSSSAEEEEETDNWTDNGGNGAGEQSGQEFQPC